MKFVSVRSSQGKLRLFEITRASVLFSRKFQDAIARFTKVRILLIPLSITFLNPKILGFSFSTKVNLTQGAKYEKNNLQKISGNFLDRLRKLYLNRTLIQKLLAVFNQQKILGNISFSEQIFHRKQTLGSPDSCCSLIQISEPAIYLSKHSQK